MSAQEQAEDEMEMTEPEVAELRDALDAALAECREVLEALSRAQVVTQEDLRAEFSV